MSNLETINRRKLIGSLASAVGILAAPAIVRASSLMSISPLDRGLSDSGLNTKIYLKIQKWYYLDYLPDVIVREIDFSSRIMAS